MMGRTDIPAMLRLKAETQQEHSVLEPQMMDLLRSLTKASYVDLLCRLYGFYQPIEDLISGLPFGPSLIPDLASRKKSHLLRHDIAYVSLNRQSTDSLLLCHKLPQAHDEVQLLGIMYVLEGSTLGGQIISRLLAHDMGVDAGHGGSFFASYGENVGPMWTTFGRSVNKRCVSIGDQTDLISAARQTFKTLGAWLFQ